MKELLFCGVGVLIGLIVSAIYFLFRCGYIVEIERYEAEKYREYFKLLSTMLQVENGENKLDLEKKGMSFKRVAVYGKGVIGNHLIKILQAENINVECVMDKGSAGVNSSIMVVDCNAKLSNVEAVIVTPIMEYKAIRENIKKNNPDINILEVRDLF